MGIISGALGAGAAIWGGSKAAKGFGRMERRIKQAEKDNRAWYDKRYNEDATQRADAQRILTETQEALRKRTRAAAGAAAVTGASNEQIAAEKAAATKAMADATAQIAVAGDKRKDTVEGVFLNNKQALTDQRNDLEGAKINNIKQAAQAMAAAGSEVEKSKLLGGI